MIIPALAGYPEFSAALCTQHAKWATEYWAAYDIPTYRQFRDLADTRLRLSERLREVKPTPIDGLNHRAATALRMAEIEGGK